MKFLRSIGREIIGLFADDEFLAVTVLVLVSAIIILVKLFDLFSTCRWNSVADRQRECSFRKRCRHDGGPNEDMNSFGSFVS